MTQDMALHTLFYPFENETLHFQNGGARVLFLNAQYHRTLDSCCGDLVVQQYFKPYTERLERAGHDVVTDVASVGAGFDIALIVAPQNQIETLYLMAQALQVLKPGGVFVIAADNKAGGSRLKKNLQKLGVENVFSESRNKCRVVWSSNVSFDKAAVREAIEAGEVQDVLEGRFSSQPGVYGWNKIDQGSQILLQHLPANLTGYGADFGCGYGFLSQSLVQHSDLRSLVCVDADWRAVRLCRMNLQKFSSVTELEFQWADLIQDQNALRGLDFVVMNPPFHQGKKADISIGECFIQNAAKSLKKGGQLWMVANAYLPYERVLNACFADVRNVFEGQGFKVFCAVR